MRNIFECQMLMNQVDSLKSISIDDHEKPEKYMTDSAKQAISFDRVMKEYTEKLGVSKTPASNDAICADVAGQITFVEFKAGYIDTKKQYSLGKKIYDSTLVFCDIADTHISEMRDRVDYILVYDSQKNDGNEKTKGSVSESESREKIGRVLSERAGKEFVLFDLERFENYCYRHVHTYSREEFEEKFISNYRPVFDEIPSA